MCTAQYPVGAELQPAGKTPKMFCPSLARAIGLVLALQCVITEGQLSPSPGNAAVPYSKVLSFGDSWTYLGDKPLKQELENWVRLHDKCDHVFFITRGRCFTGC